MITREQLAAVTATTVFLGGLALIIAGAAGPYPRLADIGAGITLGCLPVVILAVMRRQQSITRDAAETIRREGYRLGLEHAARGLITPPPVNDGAATAPAEGATIHRLHLAAPNLAETNNDDQGDESMRQRRAL
ncbi:hypothetical protein [Streptomyces sp. NPDC002104]